MVEIAHFGHESPNTYIVTYELGETNQPAVPVTVTANTYNFGGRILSGSLIVIPLGLMPH
jgi:hypothetical protein